MYAKIAQRIRQIVKTFILACYKSNEWFWIQILSVLYSPILIISCYCFDFFFGFDLLNLVKAFLFSFLFFHFFWILTLIESYFDIEISSSVDFRVITFYKISVYQFNRNYLSPFRSKLWNNLRLVFSDVASETKKFSPKFKLVFGIFSAWMQIE